MYYILFFLCMTVLYYMWCFEILMWHDKCLMELSVIKIFRLVVSGMVICVYCYIDYLFFVCLSTYIYIVCQSCHITTSKHRT
jgi:hypothetical protein